MRSLVFIICLMAVVFAFPISSDSWITFKCSLIRCLLQNLTLISYYYDKSGARTLVNHTVGDLVPKSPGGLLFTLIKAYGALVVSVFIYRKAVKSRKHKRKEKRI